MNAAEDRALRELVPHFRADGLNRLSRRIHTNPTQIGLDPRLCDREEIGLHTLEQPLCPCAQTT